MKISFHEEAGDEEKCKIQATNSKHIKTVMNEDSLSPTPPFSAQSDLCATTDTKLS